jgi:hypothetical protein
MSKKNWKLESSLYNWLPSNLNNAFVFLWKLKISNKTYFVHTNCFIICIYPTLKLHSMCHFYKHLMYTNCRTVSRWYTKVQTAQDFGNGGTWFICPEQVTMFHIYKQRILSINCMCRLPWLWPSKSFSNILFPFLHVFQL